MNTDPKHFLGRRERFRVFVLPTQWHLAATMGKDVTVIKKMQTRMTQHVTDEKFRVCLSVKPRQIIKKNILCTRNELTQKRAEYVLNIFET